MLSAILSRPQSVKDIEFNTTPTDALNLAHCCLVMASCLTALSHYLNQCWQIISEVSWHWGRVTHLCVSKLTSIASDNGLTPGRRQAIIWNDAEIFLIGPLGTNFSEILIELQTFSLKKIHLKMSSAKCRPFCLGLNVLRKGSRYHPMISVWKLLI